MNIKIMVATHKKYRMPEADIYLPIHVGKEGKSDLGYQGDNTGNNISSKNQNYCELTGLYWMWKNTQADCYGLVHYRRHFTYKGAKGDKFDRIIDQNHVQELLNKADIILPIPRNYYIETNYSQYVHAHHKEDLDTTREIIQEKYPDYIKAYDDTMKKTSGHRFNMFIMKKDKFDKYCSWLFDILFELESRLDISNYNTNDSRVFGFVSERLLDVWLNTNNYSYVDQPYIFMENQNWFVKGKNFLKRKFVGNNE